MALASGSHPVSRGRSSFEPWPVAIVGMLVGMGIVLAFFLRTSIAYRDPIVVEDAYAAGLRLSSEIDAAERAALRGWSLSLGAVPTADGVRVVVALVGAAAGAVPESVSVRRERVAEGGLDQTFRLTRSEDGAFEGVVPLPRPGSWVLEARAEVGGEPVVRRFSVEAPR